MAALSISCLEPVPLPELQRHSFSVKALVVLRTDMLRFARMQVQDRALAEDLVQETIEAALRKSSSFAGRSSLKTWVFAILRNRIIDHLRRASRSVNLSSLAAEGADLDDCLDKLFSSQGGWKDDLRPASGPGPDEAMQSQQFWRLLEGCLDTLPTQTSRVFMMREALGMEVSEICDQLGISPGNCHVILHRARMKLRTCFDAAWSKPTPHGRTVAGRECRSRPQDA